MPMRLMQELGRLLRKLWAEQAVCAAGRDLAQDASARGRSLIAVRARGDALPG